MEVLFESDVLVLGKLLLYPDVFQLWAAQFWWNESLS